jgi:ketopantoate reductase
MDPKQIIYILGAGAVGLPLAAHLANAGRTNDSSKVVTADKKRVTHHVIIARRSHPDMLR